MRTGYQPTTHLSTFPRFRQQLGQNEESLEELESRLERLVKLCGAMVEGGRAWVTQQAQFQVAPLGVLATSPHPQAGLWEVSAYFASDQQTEATGALNKMIHSMQEVAWTTFD